MMETKRQQLIRRILHVSALLERPQATKTAREQLLTALAVYTQALRDMNDSASKPHYFS